MTPLLGFVLKFAISGWLIVAITYFWAGSSFLFFKRYRPETETRMREFLDFHRAFYNRDKKLPGSGEITKKEIRNAGSGGWVFAALPFGILGDHPTCWGILVSVPTLFFGGLFLAYSWYGLRCLRLLGLESY